MDRFKQDFIVAIPSRVAITRWHSHKDDGLYGKLDFMGTRLWELSIIGIPEEEEPLYEIGTAGTDN